MIATTDELLKWLNSWGVCRTPVAKCSDRLVTSQWCGGCLAHATAKRILELRASNEQRRLAYSRLKVGADCPGCNRVESGATAEYCSAHRHMGEER